MNLGFFFPARNDIQNAGVQYVLDSVIPELVNDPNKRFIYVEIAFFARWWNEQEDSMRHIVKGLVNSGNILFGNTFMSHTQPTLSHSLRMRVGMSCCRCVHVGVVMEEIQSNSAE